jgi:hypothetical protein
MSRKWGLKITDRSTGFPIVSFNESNSLRMQFSVNVVPNLFLNFGTIKIYNLPPSKRQDVYYRKGINGIGLGPNIKLTAGNSNESSDVIVGSIHDAYSVTDGPDIITIIETGIDVGDVKRTVEPVPKTALLNTVSIAGAVKNILQAALTYNKQLKINISPFFLVNLQNALVLNKIIKLDYSLSPRGTISSIISYLNNKLDIIIYRDGSGALNVRRKPKTTAPFVDPFWIPVSFSTDNNFFNKIVIGNPIDYKQGVKFRTFLSPVLRLYQQVFFNSRFINKSGSIVSITHSGDTRSEEWYSDIDMINAQILNDVVDDFAVV